MKVVITMAGLGTRFTDQGFAEPKYKLRIGNRSLLEISVKSLEKFFDCASFVFIGLEESLDIDFVNAVAGRLGIKECEVRSLYKLSAGQAETVLFAGLQDGDSFIVYNIDTALNPEYRFSGMSSSDGWGLCFRAPGDHWSFLGPELVARWSRSVKRKESQIYAVLAYIILGHSQSTKSVTSKLTGKPMDL